MRGGIVYILQEFVFHVHCFCCPLYDFFCFVLGGGYSTVTILITGFKRLFFLISVSHSRFALLKMFSNEFFGQYREPRTSGNHVILSLSSRLQSAIRVFNFKTPFLWLVIYDSASYPEINPIDLPFGHISQVTSVFYLLGKILNIKYKF